MMFGGESCINTSSSNLARHKALRRLSSLPEKQLTRFLIAHHKLICSSTLLLFQNLKRHKAFLRICASPVRKYSRQITMP